jgi:fructosamine-3-kinase
MSSRWTEISDSIYQQTRQRISLNNPQPIGGGCINQAWKVTDQQQNNWFIKFNKSNRKAMFDAELLGLEEIIASNSILVPKPLCTGQTSQYSFIMLQYVDLRGTPNFVKTGQQLAKMHQHTQDSFGWACENTIGSTPQINNYETDWVTFWQKYRLQYQLDLALKKGFSHHDYLAGQELNESINKFFTSYQPVASLLHGDLWGGNCSKDSMGNPVLYDPAVYFGDRETDLAMTELFGGFGSRFMDSYHEIYPVDQGYNSRKKLYNLYHILNHFNLFGGGYGSQAAGMIHSLLSELR